MGILSSLFIAWVLSFFGFDNLVISGVYELFGVKITSSGYYLLFVICGILFSLFKRSDLDFIE